MGKNGKTRERTLTDMERLRLENCMLRIGMIQAELNQKAEPFIKQRDALLKAVGGRYGIDTSKFNFDTTTGAITPLDSSTAAVALASEAATEATEEPATEEHVAAPETVQ